MVNIYCWFDEQARLAILANRDSYLKTIKVLFLHSLIKVINFFQLFVVQDNFKNDATEGTSVI
jgi:hypothetical protein